MPNPVTPTAIPGNTDLQDLIRQSIVDAGVAAPVRQSAPQQAAPQQFQAAPQQVTPQQSAPPARNGQQDWFAQMGVGDDPDASMDFQEPVPQVRQPQQFQPPPRQVQQSPQQHAIPEMGEIDALLQDLPQPGAPQEPVQQLQPQGVPQVLQPQPQAQAPAPALDPEELQTRAINELMGRHYTIPEADARRLISEPEQVLPRLAATVHVNAVRDIGRIVNQMLPGMIQGIVGQQVQAIRAESEFYGRYPQLNRPEFKPFVEKGITFARQNNPTGTREQVMQEGATFSAMLIKRSYRPQAQAQPQGRAPVAPYTPAAAYGGPPVPQNPNGSDPNGNIFTQLGNDPDLFNF